MQLYIHRDGQQFGPYPVELAREYMASGNLLPGDLAWHEGAADWVPLAQVVGVAAPAEQRAWIPARRADGPVSAGETAPVPAYSNGSAKPASAPATKTSPAAASGGVNRVKRMRSSAVNHISRSQRAIGARNMGVGALFCIGGIVVTVVSYTAATSGSGGGTYLVTWGAVIFGGIQFLKGLIQFCKP